MTEEIQDFTRQKIAQEEGSQPSPEATETEGSSASAEEVEEENLPFDDHPKWKSARQTEKKVHSILDEHGYTNLDEMLDDLVQSKSLRDRVGGTDIDELVKAKEELKKIKAYWAEQELFREREDELPEERAARLEKELKKVKNQREEEERLRAEEEKANKDWARYNRITTSFIETKDSDNDRKLLEALLSRDSFINDVNISKQEDVRKMTKTLDKMLSDYKAAIIEEYRNGKVSTPQMTSVQESSSALKKEGPKNIKESSAILREWLEKAGDTVFDR